MIPGASHHLQELKNTVVIPLNTAFKRKDVKASKKETIFQLCDGIYFASVPPCVHTCQRGHAYNGL